VFDAKARLGYAFGNAMAYGFGGVSIGDWVENTDPGPVRVSGFNVGAGIDMLLGGNWLLGVDVTYRSLEGDLHPAGLFPTWSVDAKPIMAGLRLGYKF
jgi:opacity protein-like surface antigen